MRSIISTLLTAVLLLSALTACGRANTRSQVEEARVTPQTNVTAAPSATTSPRPGIDTGEDNNNTVGGTVGNAVNDAGEAVGDVVGGVGNAVGSAVNGVGNAVEDMVDGARDAVNGQDEGITDNTRPANNP